MSIPTSLRDVFIGANAAGGPNFDLIENSLRFRGSQYLTRSATGTGGSNTFTISYWVKIGDRNKYAGGGQSAGIISSNVSAPANAIGFNKDPEANLYYAAAWGSSATGKDTVAKYRDPGSWYHNVWQFDTTNSNYIKLWVNGVLSSFSRNDSFSTSQLNQNNISIRIGAIANLPYNPFDGYLAEMHMVDGQALDPTSFGEYDENGVWIPKKVSGVTYGNNGFYLDFSDPSNIGADRSGNGNNFTASGFELSNTASHSYDWMEDTPTNNYATINPLTNISGLSSTISSITNGNLLTNSNGNTTLPNTIAMPAGVGKWYWEINVVSLGASSNFYWGVQRADVNRANYTVFSDTRNYGVLVNTNNSNQTYIYGSASTTTAWTVAASDVIGVALNAATGDLSFYKNGTLQVTLSGAVNTAYPHYPACSGYATTDQPAYNYGQQPWKQTPPAGYVGLVLSELPEVSPITNPREHFKPVLYTGNSSSTQAISGVGFQPDFVWIKNRNSSTDHLLFDSVRGVTSVLKTVGSGAQETDANAFKSFDSDGFTLGTSTSGNPTKNNGDPYVAWCWKAGNGTSTNTNGSITSTVSANTTAGFSVVSYTSQSSAPQTVGHGLSTAPSFIITKDRDGTDWWGVYHSALGATKALFLNSNSDPATSSAYWNNTAPTSSVFTINTDGISHKVGTSNRYIAYCWAEVPSYSFFGTYQGNGSSDGPFVYTGFQPAFVMIKRSDSSNNWLMYDTSRYFPNPNDSVIYANLSAGEQTSAGDPIDILSNGFKLRANSSATNAGTYIYMALAEHPFGGSNVYPAPAR